MAASTPSEPAPSTSFTFDLGEHLKRKFHIGPKYWDRFAKAADGKDGDSYVPPSGAHVTLRDLARDPSTIDIPSLDDPGVRAAIEDDDGWVGTPDPTKYGREPPHLSPTELQEELEKGNVMLWKDFKRQLTEAQGEEREALEAMLQERLMQEHMFYTLKDGSKVSYWDLHQYVYNNPELQALYERRRRFPTADPTDPAGRPLPEGPRSGLDASAGQEVAVVGPDEAAELELDWGLIGVGSIWRRRPTRWLGGLDGLKDWDVEVYMHDAMTNAVLGRKYANRDPYKVVSDPEFARDVVRCGPLMGMTFVLTAARDLELKEAASSFRDLLSGYLQRQAPLVLPRRLRPTLIDPTDLNGVTWPRLFTHRTPEQAAAEAAAGPDELGVSWRTQDAAEHEEARRQGLGLLQALPDALCPGPDPSAWSLAGSALVDRSGRHWRRGAALWVTLQPEGGVLVQAQSPGVLAEQESYQLADLEGQEALSGALMDSFLGPRPLDPVMAATARCHLILPINGYSAGNKDGDPNFPIWVGPPPRLPKLRADPSAFRLPAPDSPAGPQPRIQLAGILERRMEVEVQSLLERAAAAAAGAAAAPDGEQGSGAPAAAAAAERAREAALRSLREGLAALEPDMRSLVAEAAADVAAAPDAAEAMAVMAADERPTVRLAPDLFSLARSLDDSAGDEGEQA